jgi:hypothetical protein
MEILLPQGLKVKEKEDELELRQRWQRANYILVQGRYMVKILGPQSYARQPVVNLSILLYGQLENMIAHNSI